MTMKILKALASRLVVRKLAIQAPTPTSARHGVCIAAVVKNESEYIGEWAKFHARAGVRKFLIYDDCCEDDTIDALRSTLKPDALTIIPWRQRLKDAKFDREIHNQLLAFAHAASNFGGLFRWMAFIDVDEFLVPVQHCSLPEALHDLEHAASISLPWHMFGFSGHKTKPPGGVIDNYLFRHREIFTQHRGLTGTKCIVDPCRLTALRVHSVECDGSNITWNDRGEVVSSDNGRKQECYSAERIQLNHYYTRSEEDLAEKIARGSNVLSRNSRYGKFVMQTVEALESDLVKDTTALDFLGRTRMPPRKTERQMYGIIQ